MAQPQFNGLDNTPTYDQGGAPAVLDNNATITDTDVGPGPYTGATLSVARSTGADPNDFVDFSSFGGVSTEDNSVLVNGLAVGTFANDAGTLTVTFNDQADQNAVNTVLDSLRYQLGGAAPPAQVTLDYSFNDNFNNNPPATGSITVNIMAQDQPPVLDNGGHAYYRPGGSAVVLGPNISVTDADSTMLAGATVSMSNAALSDSLAVDTTGTGVSAQYDGNSGVLTLTGSASLATYQQLLEHVTYSSSAADPTFGGARTDRIIVYQVSDGTQPSNGVDVILGFTPVLDLDTAAAGTGYDTTFTVGGSGVAIANSNMHITVGDTAIQSATVVLTDAQAGDTLTAPGAPLPFETDTSVPGQITLTFHATNNSTTASFESAIKDVAFDASGDSGITRDVTVDVTDVNNDSNITHATITVNGGVNTPPADIAPTNTVPGAQTIEANTAAAIGGLSIADPDAGSGIETTTLSVAHGTLNVATGGASVAGNGSSTVTLNGTVAQINSTLGANVTYHGAHDFFGTDTLTVLTNDNGNTGSGGPLTDTDQVTLNVGPLLAGTSGNDSFTATSGNERIDAGLGLDAISFNFRLVDANISWSGNQVIVDGPGGSSHTVLTGFEIYKFTDGTVNNADSDPLVDDLYYYSQNHDVWLAGADADAHFHAFGWKEGRNPDVYFDTKGYLAQYKDVAAAGGDPLVHYDQFGWKEGRDPGVSFDTKSYLAAYQDIAAMHIDPLAHYLQFGLQEGRSAFADGHFG